MKSTALRLTCSRFLATLCVSGLMVGLSSTAQAQATSTLEKVRASGAITMGVRESSGVLSYTLGNNKFAGYHVEICQRIIDALGKKWGKTLNINYQPVTSQNRIPLMQNGTIDIECGSTTNNKARAEQVSFLSTTFVEEIRMVTKAGAPIRTLADLNGKTVATTTGTTSVQTLRKDKRANNLTFKEVFGKDHADSFLLVETGRADAFVMDGSLLAGLVARSKNPKDYVISAEVYSIEPIAIMVRKDDNDFRKLGNEAIAGLIKSGELAKIYNKWFMQPTPPSGAVMNMPMSDNLKSALANPNDNPTESYQQPYSK
jgi:glutamate/aspartate transport system substrate-binding protein